MRTPRYPVLDTEGDLRKIFLAQLEEDVWVKPLTPRIDVVYTRPLGQAERLRERAAGLPEGGYKYKTPKNV